MLRPKRYAELERLGLGHLADQPVTLIRGGSELHQRSSCRHIGSWGGNAHLHVEQVTLPPRQITEPLCSCVSRTRPDALGTLLTLEPVLALWSSRYPQGPVPSGTTPADLLSVVARLRALEAILSRLDGTRSNDPAVASVASTLTARLGSERDSLRSLLRAGGPAAAHLREAASSALHLEGARSEREALEGLLGPYGAHVVRSTWHSLVDAGTDRPERRRRLSAVVGNLVRTPSPERSPAASTPEVRDRVLRVLSVVDDLESRFEAALASPAPLVLHVHWSGTELDVDGYRRLLEEAFVLTERAGLLLLALPRGALRRFGGVPGTAVPLPSDPAEVETVLGLWDPDAHGPLSDLASVVDAAARV